MTAAEYGQDLAGPGVGFFGHLPVLHSLLLPALLVFGAGLVALIRPAAALRRAPVQVRPPVLGRWLALNGPATRSSGARPAGRRGNHRAI